MPLALKDKAAAAVLYNALKTVNDTTTYVGAAHSDLSKDQVTVTSVSPKRTAKSFGNRRSSVNVVRTTVIGTPDNLTERKDAKIEIVSSIPVGMPVAEQEELFARAFAVTLQTWKDVAVVGKTQL